MGSDNTFGEINFNPDIMNKKRIMICGTSGTGKTTLANHISELYELPFISTSAKAVWRDFGFKSHAGAHTRSVLDKGIGMEYQMSILEQRYKALQGEQFVTDRSFVDNATYMLMELGHLVTNSEVEDFLKYCSKGMSKCDLLIFIRWTKDIVLEDDNNRIVNNYYQAMVDKIMEWVLYSGYITNPYNTKVKEITMWDFETRIKLVDGWLK